MLFSLNHPVPVGRIIATECLPPFDISITWRDGLDVMEKVSNCTEMLTHILLRLLFCFSLVSASASGFVVTIAAATAAAEIEEIKIGYIAQRRDVPPNLSNLVESPEDEGLAGGQLSVQDNNTTGRFLNQSFTLDILELPVDADAQPGFSAMRERGVQLVVANIPADTLLALADSPLGKDTLFFNVFATDDRLRDRDCRDNVMHIVPSRRMYADALAQYLMRKKWRRWFLVEGQRPADGLFAAAVRGAARKFGADIVETRKWEFGEDARRTAQAEVPVFTKGVDYDILVTADELGIFGEYIMYRTWTPRPVAGTQGLTPATWHIAHEQWGSAQLQSRFVKRNGRRMNALDYQVWAAVRAIGEAATRTRSGKFDKMADYLKGPEFELAGFKGVALTFRDWNWQLRQPILLTHPAALVSVSPQEGYLHRHSDLDTMGLDKPESQCQLTQ